MCCNDCQSAKVIVKCQTWLPKKKQHCMNQEEFFQAMHVGAPKRYQPACCQDCLRYVKQSPKPFPAMESSMSGICIPCKNMDIKDASPEYSTAVVWRLYSLWRIMFWNVDWKRLWYLRLAHLSAVRCSLALACLNTLYHMNHKKRNTVYPVLDMDSILSIVSFWKQSIGFCVSTLSTRHQGPLRISRLLWSSPPHLSLLQVSKGWAPTSEKGLHQSVPLKCHSALSWSMAISGWSSCMLDLY